MVQETRQKKLLSFELICAVEKVTLNRYPVVTRYISCAVYLDYIVTIHFVCQYPNLLTLYVQDTKTLAVKKWLPFELICSVYLENIVIIHFVCPYPNLLTLYHRAL